MAGRRSGFLHNDETRAKIKAAALINRLMEHIESPTPILDASQVNAAKALLAKVLPDLSAITFDGNVKLTHEDMLEQLDSRTGARPAPARITH